MQSAGMKVLRVWLDGQSTASTKATTITSYRSLETSSVGSYDPTVLNLLDDFMIDAQKYGIKLIISMHSWNSLSREVTFTVSGGVQDTFMKKSEAIAAFDNRLRYILNHTHKTLGNPWKQLNQYIFAFEAQNKAMVGKGEDYINTHMNWQCDHANTIKSTLGSNSGILVMTGGESWMTESVKSAWLGCAALDVVAIHAYGVGDFSTSNILTYVNQAKSAGKKLIFQEWGACYFNTENNNCPAGTPLPTSTRNNNIKTWASQITAAGVPWLYWQVLPNPDPHYGYDFEIRVQDPSWDTLKNAALDAITKPAAFDYTTWLKL
ncbi:Cellulase (glycosyl hydrolase family 5) [Rhizoctonia solani]|uniref:mannan endo-1,4-beta-mannosidase n=1 Tax=Rhizoctonia solani TaxID=456999 RepID=A0A8H7M0G5_9AGAM|nr:Cellulase (glycosyl hydrolase family 5) [Rhizoctonia solani]